MPSYAYKARDRAGKPLKGTMEAVSKVELADRLHRMGYLATQVVEEVPGIRLEPVWDRFQRIGTEEWVIFNIQFSNLLNAGVSLLASLETLSREIENRKLRETLGSVSRSVEGGESFSEALTHHPKVFSKLFVGLVKAGEASGKLDTVLERFAVYSEQQAELKQKITGALFYPAILLAAGILVAFFIVTLIIPQFAEIFMKVGIPLPLPTRILYRAGILLNQFWQTLLLFGVTAGWGIQVYAGTAQGRLRLDALKLKLPLVGLLFRKAAISRFARTLGMLVQSGVSILQSLEIVQEVIGNEVLARLIGNVRHAVEKGEKLSEPIRLSGEFPPDTVQMITVGEEMGSLDEMLNKVSDFYERSIGYTVKKLTTLLEPLLLVVMGCLIGVIMASMLLPLFDMIKILRQARSGF